MNSSQKVSCEVLFKQINQETKMNKYLLCVIFISFISLSAFSAESNKPSTGSGGGWRESYGGDSAIMEFKHLAKEVSYILNDGHYSNDFGLEITTLKSIVNLSYVECSSNLVLDGVAKDAINFPYETPQKILLDCKKWNTLSTAQKYRLAIHEYLPLAGINDTTYAFSEKIFNFYIQNKNSPKFDIQEMIMVLTSCGLERFRELSDLGGNLFIETKHGLNFLQLAAAFSCDEIVQDLIDTGLEYVVNPVLSQNYVHYGLIENAIVRATSPQERAKTIATLKVLLGKWPKLTELGFRDFLWLYGQNYSLSPTCIKESTIMHIIASDTKFKKEDMGFIRELMPLGFSLDQKNSCSQTPRSLFEKNGIHF